MFLFFFFNDTATTEIYTLSLHDALPISSRHGKTLRYHGLPFARTRRVMNRDRVWFGIEGSRRRSEEHTSELQSQSNLVCRLLLEKKKTQCSNMLNPPYFHPSTSQTSHDV